MHTSSHAVVCPGERAEGNTVPPYSFEHQVQSIKREGERQLIKLWFCTALDNPVGYGPFCGL